MLPNLVIYNHKEQVQPLEREERNMNIEEMRQHEWSISWSGGKDSTATVILCHEYGIPVKEIIYVRMMYDDDLPATLPVMTDFVDNALKVFESWGYKVRVVKSIKTAKQLIEAKYKRSKCEDKNGKFYGVTAFSRGFCKFTDVKMKTVVSLTKSEYEMIGYASDELDRLHRLTDKKCSIMAELGIKEQDTFEICRKYNLLSPLYDLGFKRDGCWFCPNASKLEIKYVKEHYPQLVKKIYDMIEMCDYSTDGLENRNNWVAQYLNDK